MSLFLPRSLPWPVWSHYRVRNRIVEVREVREGNKPPALQPWASQAGNHETLALELARVNRHRTMASMPRAVATSRVIALVEFYSRFGCLGIDGAPSDALVDAIPRRWTYAEPADWALVHAATLDLLLTLAAAFALGEKEIVRRQLKEFSETQKGFSLAKGSTLQKIHILPDMKEGSEKKRIYAILDQVLEDNLQSDESSKLGRRYLRYSRLYNLAYSQLAEWVEKGQFGRCKTCLSFFPKTDRRQQFCPAIGNQIGSLCGARQRVRKQRNMLDRTAVTDDARRFFLIPGDNELPGGVVAEAEREPS